MRLRDLAPELTTLPAEQLLGRVSYATLQALRMPIADWYDERLEMWRVLRHYGIDVPPDLPRKSLPIPCQLASHGGADRHKSATYYPINSETGEVVGETYCHKCRRSYKPFWYVYRMEHDYNAARTFSAVLLRIESLFRVPLPFDLILDHDPEKAARDELEGSESGVTHRLFVEARRIRESCGEPQNRARALLALYGHDG